MPCFICLPRWTLDNTSLVFSRHTKCIANQFRVGSFKKMVWRNIGKDVWLELTKIVRAIIYVRCSEIFITDN